MSIIILIIILILALVFTFYYSKYVKNKTKRDLLQNNFASCTGCSYWALLHYIFFTILGFLFPGQFILLIIIAVAWEFLEIIIEHSVERNISPIKIKYRYSKLSDFLFNILGVLTGYGLNKLIKK